MPSQPPPRDGRSNRFIPPDSDSRDPIPLARNIRDLYDQLHSTLDRLSLLEQRITRAASFTAEDFRRIRAELQATGGAPLNITALPGLAGDAQDARLLVATGSMPDPGPLTPSQLGVLLGTPFDTLEYVGENPKAWVPLDFGTDTFTTEVDFQAGFRMVGPNGSYWKRFYTTELININTGGVTTTSATNLILPHILHAVTLYVTVTISGGGITDLDIGDGTTVDKYYNNFNPLTAGAAVIAIDTWQGGVATNARGPVELAAIPLVLTAVGGTPTQGQVRVVVWYDEFGPPTS